MSDHKPLRPANIIPLNATQALKAPASTKVPEELAKLDGVPLAAVQPAANVISLPDAKIVRGKETANNVEFQLHEDGTLMKFIERPGFAPMQLLVDGVGRQYGIARNAEVADMICNGVNALHLAHLMQLAENQKREQEANKGGPPPAIITPGTDGNGGNIITP